MAIYEWKYKVFPVAAQVAGEELERIHQRDGKITPTAVVEDARPEDAPLHPCFEWRDDVAAEKYREEQARCLIRTVVIKQEPKPQEPKKVVVVRGFVHTQDDYQPMNVVLKRPDYTERMMADALRDLKAFQAKYHDLSQLKPMLDTVNQWIGELEGAS